MASKQVLELIAAAHRDRVTSALDYISDIQICRGRFMQFNVDFNDPYRTNLPFLLGSRSLILIKSDINILWLLSKRYYYLDNPS